MALSALLFYTQKTYPQAVITNKSWIPKDPDERLKDKIFMTVVFVVKYYCEYKNFVLPETRFEEELHCTQEQMNKILDSLSRKYNVVFRKKKFHNVGDLTLYVKDHQQQKSEEFLLEFGLALVFAQALIILWNKVFKKKGKNYYVDLDDWDKFKKEYAKVCDQVLNRAKDDPFFSKDQHKIYTVDEGITVYQMLLNRFKTFLKLPHKKDGESREEYQQRLQDTMRNLKYAGFHEFYKTLPKRGSHSYIEAQYFNIEKIDKCLKLLNAINKICSKMYEHEESICSDNDAKRVWRDLSLGGEQDFSESFAYDTFGEDFTDHIPRILKYIEKHSKDR